MTQYSKSAGFLLLTEKEAPQDALLSAESIAESIEVRPFVAKEIFDSPINRKFEV